MPKNLRELIESLESLISFSRCNAALTHLPIDDLLEVTSARPLNPCVASSNPSAKEPAGRRGS